MQSDVNWIKICFLQGPDFFKFKLNATTNTCATPANRRRWGLAVAGTCGLCHSRQATLLHILNACSVALHQTPSRYTWRHDSILLEIQNILRPFVNRMSALRKRRKAERKANTAKPKMTDYFVKAGQKRKVWRPVKNVFSQASDWKVQFDLNYDSKGNKTPTSFPAEIAISSLNPDGVIWSVDIKTVILLELTSPWEENIQKAHLRKSARYEELEVVCVNRGWTVQLFTLEVGSRGFIPHSFNDVFRKLGLSATQRKTLRDRVSDKALMCSYVIYKEMNNPHWTARCPLRFASSTDGPASSLSPPMSAER